MRTEIAVDDKRTLGAALSRAMYSLQRVRCSLFFSHILPGYCRLSRLKALTRGIINSVVETCRHNGMNIPRGDRLYEANFAGNARTGRSLGEIHLAILFLSLFSSLFSLVFKSPSLIQSLNLLFAQPRSRVRPSLAFILLQKSPLKRAQVKRPFGIE